VRENGGGLKAGSALAAAEKAAAAARTSNGVGGRVSAARTSNGAGGGGFARRQEKGDEEAIGFEMRIFFTCGARGEVKMSAGGDSGGAKMELFFLDEEGLAVMEGLAEDLAGLDGCRENVRKDIVSGHIIINWEWHAA